MAVIDPVTLLFLFGNPPGPAHIEPQIKGNEHYIYVDIQNRLILTGAFAAVLFPEDVPPDASDWETLCRIVPGQVITEDDCDPIELIDTGSFTITVSVRDNNPSNRNYRLQQLANLVRNTINGQPLGGMTIGQMTTVGPKGKPVIDPPEASVTFKGKWSMFIDGYDGYDSEED